MWRADQVTALGDGPRPQPAGWTPRELVPAIARIFLLLLLAGCATPRPPSLAPGESFPIGEMEILSSARTVTLSIEIADRERLRRIGLSGRDHLPPDAGMLFLFDEEQPTGSGFWMHRTLIPLDLALIDGEGIIFEIHTMQPCSRRIAELCPRYTASAPYMAALEVNAGYLQARRIQPGDRARWIRREEVPDGETDVAP